MRVLLFVSVLGLGACASKPKDRLASEHERPAPKTIAPSIQAAMFADAGPLTRPDGRPRAISPVNRIEDPRLVCMTTDRYVGSPQTPVTVDGKTYYGCGATGVEQLKSERPLRFAKDPYFATEVDKASSILMKDATDRVFYFESEESVRSFAATL